MTFTYSFWDTFSNNGNGLDLRKLHKLHGGAIDGTGGRKVDHSVDIAVLGHGLLNVLVDWEQGLAGSPVHLAHELASECVDDTSNRGGFSLADEVEIQHALDGSWLETVNEASCLVVEKCVLGAGAQRSTWGSKSANVVVGVGREAGSWRGGPVSIGGSRHREICGRDGGAGGGWLAIGVGIVN